MEFHGNCKRIFQVLAPLFFRFSGQGTCVLSAAAPGAVRTFAVSGGAAACARSLGECGRRAEVTCLILVCRQSRKEYSPRTPSSLTLLSLC